MTRPFTTEDFARRLERAARQAVHADLTGVLVTPGPDLLYLTGYAPIAITERITMLVVPASGERAMIVPILERPDAEDAPAAGALSLHDWTDGDDPYAATSNAQRVRVESFSKISAISLTTSRCSSRPSRWPP